MHITDAEKLRKELEGTLYKHLREFEAATGLRVREVKLREIDTENMGPQLVNVHVGVDLRRA